MWQQDGACAPSLTSLLLVLSAPLWCLVEYGTDQPGNLSTLVTHTACFQPSYNGFSCFTVIIVRIITTTNAYICSRVYPVDTPLTIH